MSATNFDHSITKQPTNTSMEEQIGAIAIPPDVIARGVLFVIEHPSEVEVRSMTA